ncbi:MAG TPA: hypothetical protein VIK93_06135 [Limnochordales bacterium]
MTTWILDTNIVIFLLARNKLLQDPRAQHMRARLHQLDQALKQHVDAGGQLLLTPVVVHEALFTLHHAYGYSQDECAQMLMSFIQAPEVLCEDEPWVRAALFLHSAHGLDFVDGYLAARTLDQPDTYLVTHDTGIPKYTRARLVNW